MWRRSILGIFAAILIVFLAGTPPACAGVWVNVNRATTQVSIERWVQKTVPVRVWVQSGYWDTSGTVWDPPWDQPPYYRPLWFEETIFIAGDGYEYEICGVSSPGLKAEAPDVA